MSTVTTGFGALDPEVSRLLATLSRVRRTLHEDQERGFEEVRTAGLIAMCPADMAYLREAVPGCRAFVGSANPARGLDRPRRAARDHGDETASPISVPLRVHRAERYPTA